MKKLALLFIFVGILITFTDCGGSSEPISPNIANSVQTKPLKINGTLVFIDSGDTRLPENTKAIVEIVAMAPNFEKTVLHKTFEKIVLPFSFSIDDSVELLDAKYVITVRVVFIDPQTGQELILAGDYITLQEYIVHPGTPLNEISIHVSKREI